MEHLDAEVKILTAPFYHERHGRISGNPTLAEARVLDGDEISYTLPGDGGEGADDSCQKAGSPEDLVAIEGLGGSGGGSLAGPEKGFKGSRFGGGGGGGGAGSLGAGSGGAGSGSGTGASASKSAGDSWACKHCTYKNAASTRVCAVCGK